MKLIIDGYALTLPPCGVKSFLFSFLKAFRNQRGEDKQSITIIVPKAHGQEDLFDETLIKELNSTYSSLFNIHQIEINTFFIRFLRFMHIDSNTLRRYILFYWTFYAFPHFMNSIQADTVFHPYQVISNYKTSAKKTVVIHDIFHWINMERYNLIQKYFYQKALHACQTADNIITISNYSRIQIENNLQIPSSKINVCFEGVNNSYIKPQFDSSIAQKIKQEYNLPNNYLFGLLSARKFKKNNIGSLKVLHALKTINPNTPYKLVLLGGDINSSKEIKNYILTNNLKKDIIFITSLHKSEDLKYFYNLSSFFLFLSFEEGFGLPPLEALGCYTFPITSNTTSLGEIYNNYLPTFNPTHENEIAKYINTLSTTNRSSIIKSSRTKLLEIYNWDSILPKYLKVIQK